MKLLAIDTATEACSLALAIGDRTLARHVVAGREQTAMLLPLLHELLGEGGVRFDQLDGIACGVGPGSFAGVRIGVGFVKGLAIARDLPIVPVLSLAPIAQGALRRHDIDRVGSCVDARMGEVYCAAFERDSDGLARIVDEPRVGAPASIQLSLRNRWAASGTGWRTYRDDLLQRCAVAPSIIEPDALPEARDALTLARPLFERGGTIRADALEPVYLRNDVALTLEQQARARREKTTRETS